MCNLKRASAIMLATCISVSLFAISPVKANALTPTYNCSESYMSSEYYKRFCDVELTGRPADDIVNIALSQVGYHEGDSPDQLNGVVPERSSDVDSEVVLEGGNYTEYAFFSNDGATSYGAWCAYFVNWCARQAGVSTQILYGKDGYVPNLAKFYKTSRKGTWYPGPYYGGDYCPQKGDIAIIDFNYDYEGGDHVAIVKSDSANPNYAYVIGGNESDSVRDGLFSSSMVGQRNIYSIMGYFHPNYALNGYLDNPAFPENYPIPTSVLKKGATGEGVKWLQSVLFQLDYFTDESVVDGVFGESTVDAIKAFQKEYELDADGIVGPSTIAALQESWEITLNMLNRAGSLSQIAQFTLLCDSTINLVKDPSQSEAAQLTWESSNEEVATVENGVVCGHKEGTATIVAFLGKEEIASYLIAVEAAPARLTYGDVNCDGKISMEDVTDLQVIIASLKTYETFGSNSQAQADVTRDSAVSMLDVVHIQKYIANLITIE